MKVYVIIFLCVSENTANIYMSLLFFHRKQKKKMALYIYKCHFVLQNNVSHISEHVVQIYVNVGLSFWSASLLINLDYLNPDDDSEDEKDDQKPLGDVCITNSVVV